MPSVYLDVAVIIAKAANRLRGDRLVKLRKLCERQRSVSTKRLARIIEALADSDRQDGLHFAALADFVRAHTADSNPKGDMMKRDGDKVMFDSATQQEEFERALMRADGAKVFMFLLLEAIGGGRRDADNWWRHIREELKLSDAEMPAYHWPERELRIRTYDQAEAPRPPAPKGGDAKSEGKPATHDC